MPVKRRGIKKGKKRHTKKGLVYKDPFPKGGKDVTFRYASIGDYFTPVSSNGVIALNSLYDHDQTNVGHQPYQYDALCSQSSSTPYCFYNVRAAKGMFEVINNTANAVWFGYMVVASNAIASSVLLDNIRENGGKVVLIPSNGYGQVKRVRFSVPNIARFCGVDKNDDTLKAASNASPTTKVYIYYGVYDLSGGISATQFRIRFEVITRAHLSGKSFIAQS